MSCKRYNDFGDGSGDAFYRGTGEFYLKSGSGNGYITGWGDGRGCETGSGNKDFTGKGCGYRDEDGDGRGNPDTTGEE